MKIVKKQQLARETFDYPAAVWPEGTVAANGRYSVVWTGGGTVQISSNHTLRLESTADPAANGWGDTASTLVTSTNSIADFDETVRMRTIAQLRNETVPAGSRGTPNPWEVAWFGWHFIQAGNDTAFYYVTLKPIGFELGKVDQRLRNPDGSYILAGGQRFLYTNTTPYPINTWHTLRVRQLGAAISVWANGTYITTFTDGPGSSNWNSAETVLTSGAWAYYHEDARVEFDDGPIVPASSIPQTNNNATNLTASPTASTIPLSWNPPANPSGTIQGYNIYKNGVKDNGPLETYHAYSLTGLAANTTYTVTVKTVVGGVESTGVSKAFTTSASSTQNVINVATSTQLTDALTNASAGQTIQLADGTYNGNFVIRNKNGTVSQPIIIQGSKNAIINGGTTSTGYAFYVDICTYICVKGFQVTGAQKSVVFDQVQNSTIDGLTCHDCGAESILIRNFSCDNTVQNCEVYTTGLVSPQFGEGIYIGLAYSNWTAPRSRTGGAPDTSDRNRIINNNIHDTSAECIDIKEGTSDGIIRGNMLEGANMSGQNYADSWINLAGCGYTVENNTGTNALLDGIQTHTQPQPAVTASNNIFRSNTLRVNAAGYGISIDTAGSGNVVYASNVATGAANGLTNISVTP